ncbi:MAG: protein-methionine-sulfoxide reductase catalytic subunit MsrP, partial [Deltaproteobacteria bacterium]|nr:protein-methionine-sulfoxide reductase catalytic subunit MsrP [Deltaproteobacteria bacterium]
MLIKKAADIKTAEITPRELYLNRRQFIASALGAGAALAGVELAGAPPVQALEKIPNLKKGPAAYHTSEKLNSLKDITSYNNFYELGVDKEDPARNAKYLTTKPWSVEVEGEVKKAKTFAIEDIVKMAPLEERVYRMRCVEAWSMVIPWVGFPLSALINQVEPTNNAKFVQFVTLVDPKRMPGQKPSLFGNPIDWPYVEGLRMDEAMHPLTILSVGLYGEILPAQNGAPLRLVVPRKYGFKSIKSIVKLRFVEKEPPTSWNKMQPQEYGFYSNVNPEVDHPRWTQATERRIG